MISSTALTSYAHVQKYAPDRLSLLPDLVEKFNTEYELENGSNPDFVELGRRLRVSNGVRMDMVRYLSALRNLAKPGVRLHWLVNSNCVHVMRSLPGASRSGTIGYEHRSDIERGKSYGLYSLVMALIYLDRLYEHDRVTADLVADCTMMGHINHPETRVDPIMSTQYMAYMSENIDLLPDIEAKPFVARYRGILDSLSDFRY